MVKAVFKLILELLLLAGLLFLSVTLLRRYDLFTPLTVFIEKHEQLPLRTALMAVLISSPIFLLFYCSRLKRNFLLEKKLKDYKLDLRELAELRRIIPVCPKCKRPHDQRAIEKRLHAYLKRYKSRDLSSCFCEQCLSPEGEEPAGI